MRKEVHTRFTLRLPPELDAKLTDAAKAAGVTKATATRLLLENELPKVAGVSFANEQQGAEIRAILYDTLTEMRRIRTELNRIGINYNAELRLKQAIYNCDRKATEALVSGDLVTRKHYVDEGNALRKKLYEDNDIDENVIKDLIAQYEQITKEVSKILCILA